MPAVVAADGPYALDGFHKLRRLPEPVEVEGELCVFDGLSSRDWMVRKSEKVGLIVSKAVPPRLKIFHYMTYAMKQLVKYSLWGLGSKHHTDDNVSRL